MNAIIVKIEIIDAEAGITLESLVIPMGAHIRAYSIPIKIDENYILRGWEFKPAIESLRRGLVE